MEEIKERKCIVYEHRKNGSRFITTYYNDKTYKDDEHHVIVEKDVSEETARLLCDQRKMNTLNCFLNELPEELRDPASDAFITAMILSDDK